MGFDDTTATPDAAVDEAQSVITNPEHARYKAYWNGDKATVDYVNGLFDKKYPGADDLSLDKGQLDEHLEAAAKEFDKTNAESLDTARAQSEAKLIELWGDQAQTNVQTITDWASQNITPDRAEALNQKYPGLFNDHEFLVIAYEAIRNRGVRDI